jgi:Zn-dependent protease with chaperone function
VIVLAAVPLLVGLVAAMGCRRAVDWLAPAMSTVLLTALALTVALATGLLLCVAAVVALAEVPAMSVRGRWSPDVLRDSIPMPPEVGMLGGMIAIVLLCSASVHAIRIALRARRTSAVAAALKPATGDFVLINDESAFAYAVPGRHHRIVASTGMLKTLSGLQRRALLAHEQAHLRHHHHVYVQLGRLAAAANPLMRPVSRAIDLAVERWADETAAREVGDPAVVARALAAAALAHTSVPSGALAGAQANVVDRVSALLRPARHRPSVGAALTVGALACWLAAFVVVTRVHALMELAESVGR